jgi:hypothetical protein
MTGNLIVQKAKGIANLVMTGVCQLFDLAM